MKQAFSEKPNPDSNDLKKLSNQTGLAKRVLQVSHLFIRSLRTKLSTIILFQRYGSKMRELNKEKFAKNRSLWPRMKFPK